jgi:oxygen-independent coproporphyrinogen-3 oxidase
MGSISEGIQNQEFPPYIYGYPPTRSYQKVDNFHFDSILWGDDLNVYIHIPFCEQKCTFCGYLVSVEKSETLRDAYVKAVVTEILMYSDVLANKIVKTLNFGGGTPSLLTIPQFEYIIRALQQVKPDIFQNLEEFSVEATPESVSSGRIQRLLESGLNRVSIGVQSFNNKEIQKSGRHNVHDVSLKAIASLQDLQVPNICCDLMYGLVDQDIESWRSSVNVLAEMHPETIELYATVAIPNTSFAFKNDFMSSREKYQCYIEARDILLAQGYIQDCHLRFILPERGFYRQQSNVFAGQSLIGFGVGARSYVTNIHYRNIYDVQRPKKAITDYISCVASGRKPIESAVALNQDEQLRRYVIYNLEHLDTQDMHTRFGVIFSEVFPDQYNDLLLHSLIEELNGVIVLTEKGLRFRDLIAKAFFSEASYTLDKEYYSFVSIGKGARHEG